jgi:hypothetical protein
MKEVISFLRSIGFEVTEEGIIISQLPDGEDGLMLVNQIEDIETLDGEVYTIINDKIEKI